MNHHSKTESEVVELKILRSFNRQFLRVLNVREGIMIDVDVIFERNDTESSISMSRVVNDLRKKKN